MPQTNAQLIGKMLAQIEGLTKTVEKMNDKMDAQAAEIQDLKSTIASLRAGGRVLLWVAGTLGAGLGLASNWVYRLWYAGQ